MTLLSLAGVYASYTFFLVKLLGPIDLILMNLAGERSFISVGLLLETFLLPTLIYFHIKYYPGGILFFYLTCDAITNCIKYGILTRVSSFLHMTRDIRPYLHYLKIGQFLVMTAHSLKVLAMTDCACPKSISSIALLVNSVILMGYLLGKPAKSSADTATSSKVLMKSQ